MANLSYPATEVRRHDRDRFLCALFAPAVRREALFALYAFNSAIARVRETVTEPMIGEIRLQWWWDRIDAIYAGTRPEDELAGALADAIAAHGLSRTFLEALIETRRRDLDDRPLADLTELSIYAAGTSAALTGLALEVLGLGDDARVEAAGRHVGIAWSLTGLLRALPFHAAQGRCFLPQDLCREVGIDPERPDFRPADPALAAAAERIAGVASDHLTQARAQAVPKAAIPALLPATLASGDLADLAKARFDPFDGRVGLRGMGRLMQLAVNGLRGRF